MTLLQPAKFFAGGTTDYDARAICGNVGIYGTSQAAHVKAGDLVLMSKLPESAAEAERINAQVRQYILSKK